MPSIVPPTHAPENYCGHGSKQEMAREGSGGIAARGDDHRETLPGSFAGPAVDTVRND